MKKFNKISKVIVNNFVGIGATVWFIYYIAYGVEYFCNHWACCVEPFDVLIMISLEGIFLTVSVSYFSRRFIKIENWIKSKKNKSEVAV